jgi:hypothetical protein
LKDGVIANFVDKHLRVLLKDELIKAKIEEITKKINGEADKIVAKEFGNMSSTGYGYAIKLNTEFEKHLKSLIRSHVDTMVYTIIDDKVKESIASIDIGAYADRIMTLRMNELCKDAINTKAKALIANALK